MIRLLYHSFVIPGSVVFVPYLLCDLLCVDICSPLFHSLGVWIDRTIKIYSWRYLSCFLFLLHLRHWSVRTLFSTLSMVIVQSGRSFMKLRRNVFISAQLPIARIRLTVVTFRSFFHRGSFS